MIASIILCIIVFLAVSNSSIVIDVSISVEIDLIYLQILLKNLVQVGNIGVRSRFTIVLAQFSLILKHGDLLSGFLTLLGVGLGWRLLAGFLLDKVLNLRVFLLVLV